jgi:hypothetical protein
MLAMRARSGGLSSSLACTSNHCLGLLRRCFFYGAVGLSQLATPPRRVACCSAGVLLNFNCTACKTSPAHCSSIHQHNSIQQLHSLSSSSLHCHHASLHHSHTSSPIILIRTLRSSNRLPQRCHIEPSTPGSPHQRRPRIQLLDHHRIHHVLSRCSRLRFASGCLRAP